MANSKNIGRRNFVQIKWENKFLFSQLIITFSAFFIIFLGKVYVLNGKIFLLKELYFYLFLIFQKVLRRNNKYYSWALFPLKKTQQIHKEIIKWYEYLIFLLHNTVNLLFSDLNEDFFEYLIRTLNSKIFRKFKDEL